MNWRTEFFAEPATDTITLAAPVFTIGSCFADEIGLRLLENKFSVAVNPLGTVYNPISIHQLLRFGLQNELPTDESYLQREEVHFNYHFHSSYSALSRNDLKNKIEEAVASAHEFFKKTEWILITYGTSFVYKLDGNQVVANCHKMPSADFTKVLLTENEIAESFDGFYTLLKSINPRAKIILTVSPVRHTKDTLELNSVSKSILRLACHTLSNKFPDVTYFPAYEIVMDDLRDYRFYKKDLIHPTTEAVDYIWEKFSQTYFNEPTQQFMAEWQKIKSDLRHKPFHPHSEKHQQFLQSVLKKLELLKQTVNVDIEIAEIKSQILNPKILNPKSHRAQ
ncbi:MAG: GSCFA domain-containing protein [Bacteroidetes bacterium]|nr:GSCFA domain-containing protein [Bacteroidota bacterium]MBS1540871.1 GSCFA domain-containing protein [Bacteroidota bacterium]